MSAILPRLVKLNIVFPTRPFADFPGKRSFFIFLFEISDVRPTSRKRRTMTANATESENAVSSLETPAVIVTVIVSGQSIRVAVIKRIFVYHKPLKTSDTFDVDGVRKLCCRSKHP